MIRSESDVILAINMARDLEGMVTGFLIIWRKYANGLFGVTIPDTKFSITLCSPKQDVNGQCIVSVKLHYSQTHTYSVPVYYDSDSDHFSESWGASNISGYTSSSDTEYQSIIIDIPVNLLLHTESKLIDNIKNIAAVENTRIKNEHRKTEIEHLQKKIEILKSEIR